jgi:CHAT domain-containing protein
VVADPATRIRGLGRLPNALREGEAVATKLQALGWAVTFLHADDAEHARVLAAMFDAEWLHYAGHGLTAGRSGWDSALPLAGEAALGVPDILSVRQVPRAVVLSACDTAGAERPEGRIQLASAFLLAGADFVIAAQGEVVDDTAPRFTGALYEGAIASTDGPELARQAVLRLHRQGEPMDTWAGFYVWVP